MKLQKVTVPDRRWYDDACGTALAMELVGERWSLLIVRELMFGPRRFGEVKASLGGISANVLTQRLGGLEAAGILVRRRLPPPASVQVYELTPWGYEADRPLMELGRWAVRSTAHDPTLPLSPASLMMSFRTMYAGGIEGGRVGFRLGEDGFVAALGDAIGIQRADPAGADALVEAAPEAVAGWIYGGVPLPVLEGEGAVRLDGDRALLDRFARAFPLPAKAAPG